jgi:hypothetical protein
LFPPSVNIRDIDEFVVKDKNIVSFKRVSAEIPLLSLFSKVREVNLSIHEPKVVLDASLLKGRKKKPGTKQAFKINKVNIIDGEVVFDSPKLFANLVKFNLVSFSRKDATIYRLTSPHLKITFPLSKKQVTIQGQMLCEFRELENSWRIGKFYWETEFMKVNVNGRLFKDGRIAINIYTQGSPLKFLDPILKKQSIHEFMYGNARLKKSKMGTVSLSGNFNFYAFTINGEPFRNLKGTVEWDKTTNRIRITTRFDSDDFLTTAFIEKNGKEISIDARNLPAAKFARAVDIFNVVPMAGLIKRGKVKINGRDFKGSAVLEQVPDHNNPLEFNAAGDVDFTYNSKTKRVTFFSPNLEAEFGKFRLLKGISTPKQKTKLTLQFKAAVDKAQFLDKYTRYYIRLPLDQWKLKGGNSSIDLDIKKVGSDFFIESDVHLKNFLSGSQRIDSMKGHISSAGDLTRGDFAIRDNQLTGQADFTLDKQDDNLEIRFNDIRGESHKVLTLLDIDLSLYGPMQGNFTYSDRDGMPFPLIKGKFTAPQVNFYDFILDNLKGDLEYSDAVSLKNLTYKYMNGSGKTDIYIHFDKRQFDIDGTIDAIDIHRLNDEFKGRGDLRFSGRGEFEKDPIKLSVRSGDIYFFKDRSFTLSGEGRVFTDFSRFRLESSGTVFYGTSRSPVSLRLNQEEGQFSGDFEANVSDINLLIPWGDNKGGLTLTGKISGRSGGQLGAEGHAYFKGKVLSFPNFPHVLEDFSGDMTFVDLNFNLRSLTGTMGGGAVQSSGYLTIKENSLDTLFLSLSGKNMTLYPMDRTSFNLDSDLTIKYIKERKKLLMSGTMDVHSGLWEREIDESVYFNTNPSLSTSGSNIMDMLEFELKLVGNKNIRVNNALAEANGKFNLRLTGSTDFPVLLGVIESREGKIIFPGKKFDLIKAKLSFNDKFHNDPQMKIESETFIKNYRIRFDIGGSASQSRVKLQSSPPLPTRDILSLISVGELFQRPTSTELSTQIGTGTTGLIASELTEAIKKRTKKIFGNYMLRFDPNISSITGSNFLYSSRIIVGKEVSKDFLIVYSTNISTRRLQMVYYIQYQISPTLSLIGMRNEEEDSFGIELRFRKRH